MPSLTSGRPAFYTLAVLAATAICPAQVTMYSSRTAWQAAAAGIVTIDFGTAAPPPRGSFTAYPSPPGLTLSGVNFSTTKPGTSLSVASQSYCCPTYARSFDSLASPFDGTGIQVTLNNNATAVGFDLFTIVVGNMQGTNRDQVDVTIAGQKFSVTTPAAPATTFLGFVLTSPVSSLTITPRQVNGQTQLDIVNFSFGSAMSPSAGGTTPSAIALQSAANPSNLGQAVTLTASLTPSTGNGTVTFYDGVSVLGMRPVAGGQAALTTTLLPFGARSLKAFYSGDATYQASASPVLSQTVVALGQSGFKEAVPYGASVLFPGSIVVADFNGDGKADIAETDRNFSKVGILLGNGDGTFRTAVEYGLGTGQAPLGLAVGDFNGDGKADLVVANGATSAGNVAVLLGNGDGTFQAAVNYAVGVNGYSLVVADFNGDGLADLAVANHGSGNISILLGKGDGTFRLAVNVSTGKNPSSIAAGDFNGDGKADLVTANDGGLSIHLGNGDGTFKDPVTLAATGGFGSVVAGDFTGRGRIDLAASGANDSLNVLLSNGDGTFKPAVVYTVPKGLQGVAVGDFNGDGVQDLVTGNGGTNNVNVLLGNGDGTFKPPVSYAATQAQAVAVADFNGDGRSDVAAMNFQAGINVLLGIPVYSDLTITLTDSGNLAQGQKGASYTITVSNIGAGPTGGTVAVTDTLPAPLTATAIAGTGWNCTLASTTCTRSDALPVGGTYPPITLTVNVAPDAPASVVNTATVSGGGELNLANDSAMDTANVTATLAIVTMALDPGSPGLAYDFTLAASGGAPPYTWAVTSGALPDGLTMSDSGEISGMPTTDGDSTFAVTVTDSAGTSATAMFTLTIADPPAGGAARMRREH